MDKAGAPILRVGAASGNTSAPQPARLGPAGSQSPSRLNHALRWSPKCRQRDAGSTQLFQQRFCLFQIGRIEAFGEAAAKRGEELAGF